MAQGGTEVKKRNTEPGRIKLKAQYSTWAVQSSCMKIPATVVGAGISKVARRLGIFDAFRYEKTHTVVDVGLVVLKSVGGYQLSSNDRPFSAFQIGIVPIFGPNGGGFGWVK
ncbi:MAG: hypothetical protein ACKVJH_05880 [Flavobacteriales bacterium]